MRALSGEMAARLRAPVTTLCLCWRFERRDGQVHGATDHDCPIVLDGVSYAPVAGIDAPEFSWSDGLAPGRASMGGVLDATFITSEDLDAGLWDGARVQVWRVDWSAPQHHVRIWSGRLSEVTREDVRHRAELVSLKADLEARIGRVYARACDAELGDARCGVDLTLSQFRAQGVAVDVFPNGLTASGLGDVPDGWFRGGVLTWTGGARGGLSARVALHAGERLELVGPVGEPGDAFVVTVGCDKSFAMCGERFGNRDNFRGYPHMPGPDAVLAGPAAGSRGGRR